MRIDHRGILELIALVALAVTPVISMAQTASTESVKAPAVMLMATRAVDSVLTVNGDSTYEFSYQASGSHHCDLEVKSRGGAQVVTAGIAPNVLMVEKIGRDHPWYPVAKFPTTVKVTCYDIHGAVTRSSKTLVIKRG